jgi:CO dehydrogenase/acetyl-CoA synthase gamma subunit (corrinoid Fe-S protein)
LPLTNCKVCGHPTCMAYAAALREGEASPEDCSPLSEEKYHPQRDRLLEYWRSFGWRALDE